MTRKPLQFELSSLFLLTTVVAVGSWMSPMTLAFLAFLTTVILVWLIGVLAIVYVISQATCATQELVDRIGGKASGDSPGGQPPAKQP